MDKVRFHLGQELSFWDENTGATLLGRVYIIDPRGTFFQTQEPSYDIMVYQENGEEHCLYKHLRQSLLVAVGENHRENSKYSKY